MPVTYTVEQLVAATRTKGSGRGIGLAADYMRTLSGRKGLTDGPEWRKALKDAESRLVFRGHKATILSASKGGSSGHIEVSGTPLRKDADKLAAKSIFEFENVLTTKDVDRDGDELNPKGAEIDPSMPLLWQHDATQPIGKLFNVLKQDEAEVVTHFGMADVPLAWDAVKLIEYGALRISHGFKPKEFEPIDGNKDGSDDISGWRIHKYEVMEGSLVSVPANVHAVIRAYSRFKSGEIKLRSPLVIDWAKGYYDDRPVLVKGGWTPPALKAAGGKGGTVIVNVNTAKAAVKPVCRPVKAKPKKDDGEPTDNPDDEFDDTVDDPDGNPDGDPKTTAALADVVADVQALAQDETMPAEAVSRLGVVESVLTEVGGKIGEYMTQLAAAGESQDVATIRTVAAELADLVSNRLAVAKQEIDEVGTVPGLDEGAVQKLGELSAAVGAVVDAITGMSDDELQWDDDSVTDPADESDDQQAAITCPECKAENPGDAAKCGHCGYDLSTVKEPDPDDDDSEIDAAKALEPAHCNECGTDFSIDPVDSADRVCPHCHSEHWDFKADEPMDGDPDDSEIDKDAPAVCPACDAMNAGDSRFCNQCGTQINGSKDGDGEDDDETHSRTDEKDDFPADSEAESDMDPQDDEQYATGGRRAAKPKFPSKAVLDKHMQELSGLLFAGEHAPDDETLRLLKGQIDEKLAGGPGKGKRPVRSRR